MKHLLTVFCCCAVGLLSAQEIEETQPTQSNIKTYTPSKLLSRGQWDIKSFAMQWSFFSDNAGIQPPGEKLNSLVKSKNRHHFAGVGLRFIHKYIYRAVLRLDYGIALHGQKRSGLVFGVGQYF